MSSNTDFLLAIEDLTVSFDGFKAVDQSQPLRRCRRAARDHRPERRGQDHGARLICGKTQADRRAASSSRTWS